MRAASAPTSRKTAACPFSTSPPVINCGDLYVPKDKAGLGTVLGDQLIKGGTTTREGSAIEDRIDFLGGSLNFNVGERTATLSLSVLTKDLDEGLALFFDVLRNPVFREEPLKLAKARFVEQLRQANDQPNGVLSREYEKLLYGDNALTWQPTKASYEGITAADLKAFHAKYFSPKNVILAVSGDFAKPALKTKIDKFAAGWKGGAVSSPALPKVFPMPEPGVYFIQKAINQGYINLGHLGFEDTNPDFSAVQVMNFILGGGSFTSRITTKVRSTEGLSYNQGSRFTYRWGFPGHLRGLRPDQIVHGRLRHLAHSQRVQSYPQGAGRRRRDGHGDQLFPGELRRRLPVRAGDDVELR